jgi:hypothetical protein
VQAAYLQEVQATDPARAPWALMQVLARHAAGWHVRQKYKARPELLKEHFQKARPPIDWSLAGIDVSSIEECERAAVSLYSKIAYTHGWDEARRIFKELGEERTRMQEIATRNNMLLYIYDLPPPLGGNIKRLARQVAAANKYAAKMQIPQNQRFAKGEQNADNITRQINRLLAERRKKAQR